MPEHEHRRSAETEFEQRGPTVRDRRRIDPETYEVREPQATAAPTAAGTEEAASAVSDAEAEVIELKAALAERTSDLQRLQAEYVNYKRRVDRDRDLSRKVTIEGVLKDFLSVLDDVRSAREHDELSGGFKAVADEIERVTSKYGLETFGEAGDPFNPHIHEALLHAHAEGIDGPDLRGDPAAGLPNRRSHSAAGPGRGRRARSQCSDSCRRTGRGGGGRADAA